jgi:uncharacterized protein YggL (DUF469 family)
MNQMNQHYDEVYELEEMNQHYDEAYELDDEMDAMIKENELLMEENKILNFHTNYVLYSQGTSGDNVKKHNKKLLEENALLREELVKCGFKKVVK